MKFFVLIISFFVSLSAFSMDESERWNFMPKRLLTMDHLNSWVADGCPSTNLNSSLKVADRVKIKQLVIDLFILQFGSLQRGARKIIFDKNDYPKNLRDLHTRFSEDIGDKFSRKQLDELAEKIKNCTIPEKQFSDTGRPGRLFVLNTFLWLYNINKSEKIIFARDIKDPANFYAVRYFNGNNKADVKIFLKNWEEFLINSNVDFGNFTVNDLLETSTLKDKPALFDEIESRDVVLWKDERVYQSFESDKPIKIKKREEKKSEFRVFLKSVVKFFESPAFENGDSSSIARVFIPSGYSMFLPGKDGKSELVYQEISNGKGFFTIYRPDALIFGQKIHPLIVRVRRAYNVMQMLTDIKYKPKPFVLNILFPKANDDARLTIKEVGGLTAKLELKKLEKEMKKFTEKLDEAGYEENQYGGWQKRK